MPWTRDQVAALHAKNERGQVSDKMVNKMDRYVKKNGFRQMSRGGYVDEEDTALDRLVRKYAGGAIEPVYEPLDEQDSTLLEEEPEEERHHKELLRAFAGALARTMGRR